MPTMAEAYGVPDRANTAERALSKLRQGNRDFVSYYAEFQRLIADLQWNDAALRTGPDTSLISRSAICSFAHEGLRPTVPPGPTRLMLHQYPM
jgi:hypothetical protein